MHMGSEGVLVTLEHLTVALLNIVPIGAIICGENTRDHSAIFRYFSYQILAHVVQYLARLKYRTA
jgi:hypothetical protein